MVRCVVTGAIRAALLVSTCLCPCYKGCCSVTCLESTFQAHRGTFPAWDEHPSTGDAGVAISWPSLPVRTRGACFPRVQDRGCPGEPAQKQPCWCSPGCSRCLAWTGAPGLRRGQPPPGLTSGQGEMEENQRTYSCREPLPRACCSFSPCPHLSICRNIFPNLLRLQLGQLETGNAPSWWCPCRVLDAHVVEQLVLWGGKPQGQVNRVLLPCLGGSGGL